MSDANPIPGPSRPSKPFPFWPLWIMLGLSLLGGGAGWGLNLAYERLYLSMEAIRGWNLLYWAPGFAALVLLLARRSSGARPWGLGALLLLVLLQGALLGQGGVRLNRLLKGNHASGAYASLRHYAPLADRPGDWPDPLQPEIFELGGGVRLAMSTVCVTDAAQQTLPVGLPRALPQPALDGSVRPLTPASLRNLVALTRAMGYLRFFHPSDEAAKAYWSQWTILGIQAVEEAATPEDLAARLQAFFAPLAPTAQFLAPGAAPAKLAFPPGGTQVVRWQHHGLGTLHERTNFPGSRSVRLADVAILWTVMQHFYPYFDVVPVDWAAELPKALAQAAVAPDQASLLRTLRTLMAPLQDGHGSVLPPATGEVAARPPVWLQLLDGRAYVKAGPPELPPGSEVLAVDGEPTAERLARLRLETSAATEGWMAYRLQNRLLYGCPGPKVRLAIRTPRGQDQEVSVALAKPSTEPTAQPPLAELRPGVWYVDLDRIEAKDFEAALPRLAKAKGVLFDLRGYPKLGPDFLQHLTDRPLTSAHWEVPLITRPDGRQWAWDSKPRWQLKPLKPRLQGKVVFLTGGGAISYAESCLGIVEAYHLAEIVGEPSAGTNGNINPFKLPDGFTVVWTGMKVLKHDGSRHHGIGIQPTVPVQPTPRGLAEGRDEVLEKGLEVIAR